MIDTLGLSYNPILSKAVANSRITTGNTSNQVNIGSDFGSILRSRLNEQGGKTLTEIFDEAAEKYNVDVRLLRAIGMTESGFNPKAGSKAGAKGVMQLMPSTAKSLGVTDPYDAEQNIMGGAKLISQLLKKYDGNVELALAAYNAGSGNVAKYGGIPPFKETQSYVKTVIRRMNEGVTIPGERDKNLNTKLADEIEIVTEDPEFTEAEEPAEDYVPVIPEGAILPEGQTDASGGYAVKIDAILPEGQTDASGGYAVKIE